MNGVREALPARSCTILIWFARVGPDGLGSQDRLSDDQCERLAEGGCRTVFDHGRGDGLQDGQPNILLSARSAVASRSFSSRRKMSYSAM